jgi:pimeloyl-ACP methyl ester carboxylesterase
MAAGCLKDPYDKSAIEKKFVDQQHARFSQYVAGDRIIHYAAAGRRGAPLVVLIHGTPGSWHAYAELMTDELLLSKAYLVAVDRPGFGKSSKGGIVTSLAQQAAFLQPLIERESTSRKAILVGHSLGAPIAARFAMDYPKLVTGMVLVAPSLDPDLEKPRWYNHVAASSLVAWAVPKELALANQEIMPFSQELAKMIPLWSRIQVPVIVVQGEKDRLVSPANADFAERMLNDQATLVRVADQGHFILWKRPRLIRNQILALLPQPKK